MTTLDPTRPHANLFGRLLELLSDSAVYGLSTLLTQLVGFLLLPLYTQHLKPSDYGVLAMLTVITMTFTPLTGLCLPSAAYRRLNLQKDENERGVILTTTAIGVAVISCIMLLIGMVGAEWVAEVFVGDKHAAPTVRLTMLTAAVTALGDIARVELRSRRRARVVGALNVTTFIVTAALTIRWVVYDGLGAAGVVQAGLSGAVFATMSAFAVVHKRFKLRFDRDEFRRLAAYGWPLVPHGLIAAVSMTYSQYSVRKLLGLDQAGLFDMAVRFALPLGLVVNAIHEAWVPYKFHVHASDDQPQQFFRHSFTYYLAMILFLWVGISAWGPELLRWMTDARFHEAASLIALTALVRVAWGTYLMMGSGIELGNDTRPFSLISLTGLIVVVVASTLIIPVTGAAGAAVATSLGYFAMAFMARRLARTRFEIHYDWSRVASLAGIATLCVCSTYFAASLSLGPRLIVAGVIPLTYALLALRVLRTKGVRVENRMPPVTVEVGS